MFGRCGFRLRRVGGGDCCLDGRGGDPMNLWILTLLLVVALVSFIGSSFGLVSDLEAIKALAFVAAMVSISMALEMRRR